MTISQGVENQIKNAVEYNEVHLLMYKFEFMQLYTSTLLHLRGKYFSFFSTTFV